MSVTPEDKAAAHALLAEVPGRCLECGEQVPLLDLGPGGKHHATCTGRTNGAARRTYRSRRLDSVTPETVRWLWPRRWPLGKLVVFDGDPDVGKSTVCCDCVARITKGLPLPGEDLAAVPASNVVLMAAEDGLADTIRPRLDAAGADVARVHHFDAVRRLGDDDGEPVEVPPTLPDDISALEALVTDTASVLIVVDVMMAYLSGRADSHRDQDVRRALAPLAEMAERTKACVVLIRHVPKSQRRGGQAISAGSGSIGIIGAARAGMVAAPDPTDEAGQRRVLARSKGNLAPPWRSLAYRLLCATCRRPDCDANGHGPAAVEWLGETDVTGDQLLAPRVDDRDDDSTDARSVLSSILRSEPLWVKDAIDRMAEAGFTKDQARRAKERLNVRSEKFGKPGDAEQGWKWVLPDSPEDGTKAAKAAGSDTPPSSPPSVPPSQTPRQLDSEGMF